MSKPRDDVRAFVSGQVWRIRPEYDGARTDLYLVISPELFVEIGDEAGALWRRTPPGNETTNERWNEMWELVWPPE